MTDLSASAPAPSDQPRLSAGAAADRSAVVALIVIGVIAGLSLWLGGSQGVAVASAAVGGIAGWMTKGALQNGGQS